MSGNKRESCPKQWASCSNLIISPHPNPIYRTTINGVIVFACAGKPIPLDGGGTAHGPCDACLGRFTLDLAILK